MSTSSQNFCERAVAYLKPALQLTEDTVQLPDHDAPVITDLNNGLLVAYVVDQDNRFHYVQQRHLVDAGMTAAALHQSGVENLSKLLAQNGAKVEPYGHGFAVFFGGNFEASLILVETLWDKYVGHLAPNGFIAAIPARDMLAFCDAQSEAGIGELRQIIKRVEGGDHSITSTLYRRAPSARTWMPYAD